MRGNHGDSTVLVLSRRSLASDLSDKHGMGIVRVWLLRDRLSFAWQSTVCSNRTFTRRQLPRVAGLVTDFESPGLCANLVLQRDEACLRRLELRSDRPRQGPGHQPGPVLDSGTALGITGRAHEPPGPQGPVQQRSESPVDDAALPNGSALAKATAPVKGAPAVALTLTPVADSIAAVTVSLPLTKAKVVLTPTGITTRIKSRL
jgi:hypothetical protein